MDREYLKRVLTYVIVSVVAIGIMIYVGYHMVSSFTSDVETTPAYIDSFAETVTFDAYILRQERVLTSKAEGTVNYLVGDGEKVAVGDELADICRSGSDGIRERVAEIDKTIKTLTEIESGAAYASTSDAANIESRIRELLQSVNMSVSANDMLAASTSAETMMAQLNKHAIVTGRIDGFADQIEALNAERAGLISQLTNVAETVSSDVSAYFYYDVDGYESAFSYEDIDALTLDDIYGMRDAEASAPSDDTVGKLVLDYVWHLVIPMGREEVLFFEEGGEYDIVFNAGGETMTMKLRRIITEAGGENGGRSALVFDCSIIPEGFEYTRMQPVTVCVREYAGFRVPLSAVRVMNYDEGDVYGVFILYGGVVCFRRIEVILTQDGYALCDPDAGVEKDDDGFVAFPELGAEEPAETEPPPEYEKIPYLSLYDLVIVSARGLYDGKIVSG